MSYYFNNGAGRIWSDIKYTVTTRQFEDVYSYKTQLDPQCKTGIYYYTPSFYIKDGSTPWFDSHWDDNGEITAFDARYLCVGRFTISSLSSKYTLPDNFSCYYIPANTTPELIKYDVFKNDNGTFKSLFNTVDLNKGGKVYWRIPESSYSGYNFSNYYSVFEHIEDKTNVLHSDCRNDNFITDRQFIYFGKDTSYNFHPNIGNFIKCEPNYYDTNKFGFQLENKVELYEKVIYYKSGTNNTESYFTAYYKGDKNTYEDNQWTDTLDNATVFENYDKAYAIVNQIPAKPAEDKQSLTIFSHCTDLAPNNFRLDKTLIPGEYTKLKVKMDALIVYGNNGFGEPYETKSRIDNRFINTYGSFSANNIPGTNPYCLALFYASNNDEQWNIPNSTYTEDHPYINNGEIFSNLKTNGDSKPLVKDTNHYKIKYIKYNNSEVKEVQEWTNKHVWSHFRPVYLTTGWHKMYPGIRNVTSSCTSAETCPICGSETYRGAANAGSMKCDNATLTHFPIWNPAESRYFSPSDFPVPYYRKDEYDSPVSASAVYNWIDGMNCCGGKGYVYKYYVKNGKLYRSSETATCPRCTNNGESLGKGWNWCRCVDASYKDIWTTRFEDDFGNIFEDYKLQMNPPKSGYVNCTRCGYTATNSRKEYRPYKNNSVIYKFKFCTKTTSFNGYIFNSEFDSISAASKYTEVASMDDVKPENIPAGKLGVYCHSDTTENEFPDYDNLITKDWFSGFSGNVTNVSSNWFIYVKDTYANGTYNYYYQSNNNNSSPEIRGAGNSTTDPYSAVWYMKTSSTNTTVTDPFGNTNTMGKWNPTGNTPACACNFTFANVQLNYDINLSECTGKYIHIAYPYTTIFNSTQTNVDSFMIPQISMSYEAE